jgi:hypothetical protein
MKMIQRLFLAERLAVEKRISMNIRQKGAVTRFIHKPCGTFRLADQSPEYSVRNLFFQRAEAA